MKCARSVATDFTERRVGTGFARMFMYNVRFRAEDVQGPFSQEIKVIAPDVERASALARERMTGKDLRILDERVDLISNSNRSEEVRRVYERMYGYAPPFEYTPLPRPADEPKVMPDPEKLRRTLWAIVECIVNKDLVRLPELCHLNERATPADYFNEVNTYPASLIMPPDDRLETLIDGTILTLTDSPPKWHFFGSLYSEEEGKSDLKYVIDVSDEGREHYEVELGGIYVP